MDDSDKTRAERPPDSLEADGSMELWGQPEAASVPAETGPGLDEFPYDQTPPPPGPEEEETPVEPGPEEAAPEVEPGPAARRPGRWRILSAAAGVLLLGLAGLTWVMSGTDSPETRAHEETAALAQSLAPVIRAESLDPNRLVRAEKELAEGSPKSLAAQELALGAAAFLQDELREAHQRFDAAAALAPDLPDLISFQAAASLRQGNSALAGDLYRRALSLKAGLNYPPLELASDELGLALSLFFLQRPAEALPLADKAWQTRVSGLGLGDPDTLSAANRLATIQVALGRHGLAEELLKTAYQGALTGKDMDAALEETRLLLTVLHNQSGRLEELEDFFRQVRRDPSTGAPGVQAGPEMVEGGGQAPEPSPERGSFPQNGNLSLSQKSLRLDAPPQDDSTGAIRPGPEADGPPPSAPSLPPATAENLAEWERIAAGLDQASPDLAADLRLRIMQGREVRKGRDRHQPEFRADLLALVRAYLAAGRYDRALEELRPLEEAIGRDSEDFIEYADLLGQSLAGRRNFKEAADQWQAAAELADGRIAARIKAKKKPDPSDVAHSLDLHLKLADLFLQQGRVPQEAEIELLAALGALDRLGPKTADSYPDTARVYLRLARLMWEMDQTRKSADFYRRSQKVAEDLGPRAEPAQKEFLAKTAALAAREAEALAAKQSRPPFPSELGPDAADLPSPDVLRLELSALAALGRRAEFQDRLEPILKEAAQRYGQSSQYFMRYYSLKLKGLEEEGRIDDLTAELRRQATQPPGRNDAERALNRGSALIYAARVNEKAGRPAEAVKLYEEALTAISGREEDIITARRRAVEEALERLRN